MSRKPLVRECPPTTWYFRQPRYLRYMSREITSIFVGAYCVLLVVGLHRLANGPEAVSYTHLTLPTSDLV